MEFPQMYEHLDKLERYIGRPITRLKAPCSFEEYFYSYVPKTSRSTLPSQGLGWPTHTCRWCTGRLKTHVVNRHLRDLRRRYGLVQYIGIAADETHRCKGLRYPLVEWGMTESDCLAYCRERGFDWAGCTIFFAGYPAGAVRCSLYRSCESCAGTARNCGKSSSTWTPTHGIRSAATTPPHS